MLMAGKHIGFTPSENDKPNEMPKFENRVVNVIDTVTSLNI